jgi:hypothetical protein
LCSGAVSRYKAECELVVIPGYCFGFWHWSKSGFITEFVISQGAEVNAKTVTSLLIIPSVLAVCLFDYYYYLIIDMKTIPI